MGFVGGVVVLGSVLCGGMVVMMVKEGKGVERKNVKGGVYVYGYWEKV